MANRRIALFAVSGILCVVLGGNLSPIIQGEPFGGAPSLQQEPFFQLIRDRASEICGYVSNNETGEPIADVDVSLFWTDSQGYVWSNDTQTDVAGLYLFSVAGAVEISLYFWHQDYFSKLFFSMDAEGYEIFWFNTSLTPIPEANVLIQGYLTDNSTGEPVEGAQITVYWTDMEGHSFQNNTNSDASGYYFLGTISGDNQIRIDFWNQYFNYWTEVFLENNSIFWLNVSLVPYPPVSAFVCGFITDEDLGIPIPNVEIYLSCHIENGSFYNNTNTDENGFYRMGTIPGQLSIYAYASNYSSPVWIDCDIEENQILWINLSLDFNPYEDSLIRGFVMDTETRAPVRNALIKCDWRDDIGHLYSTSTFTDQKGYYSTTVPAGQVRLFVIGNGYVNQQTQWIPAKENSEQWLNTTLTPTITVVFVKPHIGIYINNESRFPILTRIFPKTMPLIIGPLEILVNITNATLGCNRVEFYIDSNYCGTDQQAPFTFSWNQTRTFPFRHELKAIAYDNAGPCTIETILVRKIS